MPGYGTVVYPRHAREALRIAAVAVKAAMVDPDDDDALDMALALVMRAFACAELASRPPTFVIPSAVDIRALPSAEWVSNFRFPKWEDVASLAKLMGLPRDGITGAYGHHADRLHALGVVIAHLATGKRWCDLIPLFGKSTSWLSVIYSTTVRTILVELGHKRTLRLKPARLAAHAAEFGAAHVRLAAKKRSTMVRKYRRMGARYGRLCRAWERQNPHDYRWVVGSVDGTMQTISRPTWKQRQWYTAFKHTHAIKYQAVTLPNGIIGDIFGPERAPMHDSTLFSQSGMRDVLRTAREEVRRETDDAAAEMMVLGDGAYVVDDVTLGPFTHRERPFMSDDEAAYNGIVGCLRVVVENSFGGVGQLFTLPFLKRKMKVWETDVDLHFQMAVLLANCKTCMYGNQISDKFGLKPPSVSDYLLGRW